MAFCLVFVVVIALVFQFIVAITTESHHSTAASEAATTEPFFSFSFLACNCCRLFDFFLIKRTQNIYFVLIKSLCPFSDFNYFNGKLFHKTKQSNNNKYRTQKPLQKHFCVELNNLVIQFPFC